MKEEYRILELIDHYLSGQLEGEALHSFEQRMQADQAFREQVEVQQMTNNLLAVKEQLPLMEEMQRLRKKSQFRKKTIRYGMVAGGIGLGLATFLFLNDGNSPQGPDSDSLVVVQETKTPDRQPSSETQSPSKEVVKEEEADMPTSKAPQKETENKQTQAKETKEETQKEVAVDSLPETSKRDINKEEIAEKKEARKEDDVVVTKEAVVDCDEVTIEVPFEVANTCQGEATGSIEVFPKEIQGGRLPYEFSLDSKEKFTDRTQFEDLAKGEHRLFVRDGQGCVKEVLPKPHIFAQRCAPEVAFNPSFGETWQVPVPEGQQGDLQIMTASGDKVYETAVFEGDEWDGRSSSGEELKAGYYLFQLKLSDGKLIQGGITIIR